MTRLLSDRIKDLHLKPDSPYPSETKDGRDMVLQWRRSQRLKIVDLNKCPNCGGEADNGHDRCYPPNPYYCKKCNNAEDFDYDPDDGGMAA